MTEFILTAIFIITFCILMWFAKKFLYHYEHESAILKELDTFQKNLESIEASCDAPDFKLGDGHLYQN